MRKDSGALGNFIKVILVALFAAAIYQEMQKPPEEREWHGYLANLIPYDFRFPTKERLRARLWNPEDPRIFTEHFFGVGWSVNFYALLDRLQMLGKEETAMQAEAGSDIPEQIP